MQKRKLTQEDLDNNPELAEQGLKAGDEIEIPEANETSFEPGGDEEEGGDRPGNKPQNP